MAIHAKYDLTRYAFSSVAPKCFYSVDYYVITYYDMESTIADETECSFDSWEEVRDFITAFHLDPFYDDYNYSIVGIVVN